MEFLLEQIVKKNKGLLRGPFGGALKKEIFVPKTDKTYKVYEQGTPLYGNPNYGSYYITEEYFHDKMENFEVLPGDILVSCSGVNYGAIYQMPDNIEKGIINQALLRIRIDENKVDSKFFCYLFKNLISRIITSSSGDSTIPNFPPLSLIKKVKVDLPSLNEQKKIVAFLKPLEDKINNNNKIIDNLFNNMLFIYSYWFEQMNFEYNGKAYSDNGGKLISNKDYPIEIPKFWKVCNFLKNNLFNLIKPGIKQFDGDKIYFSTSEINNNDYNPFINKVSFFNRESRANMEPSENSVWFAKMKKSIKHIAFTKGNYLIDKAILSTGFMGLQCSEISFEYVFCLINSTWFEHKKDDIASGSTQESITNSSMNFMNILIPDDKTLELFHNKTKFMLDEIYELYEQNDLLRIQLNKLTPLLLSGLIFIK